MRKILYWLPRILSVLLILFISIFVLDTLNESNWFLALLMHLIPSFVLIIITVLAWKRDLIGGMLYFFFGLVFWLFFKNTSSPSLVIFPLFLISGFYLINYFYSKN